MRSSTHSVRLDGEVYHMWNSGGTTSPPPHSIGYALSLDGVHWTRYMWNPVVLAPDYEGYDFARVLVNDSGIHEMWYRDVIGNSFLRATSDRWDMVVFVDGFESGDTSEWSATVP